MSKEAVEQAGVDKQEDEPQEQREDTLEAILVMSKQQKGADGTVGNEH